jgi:hypothetical protein
MKINWIIMAVVPFAWLAAGLLVALLFAATRGQRMARARERSRLRRRAYDMAWELYDEARAVCPVCGAPGQVHYAPDGRRAFIACALHKGMSLSPYHGQTERRQL